MKKVNVRYCVKSYGRFDMDFQKILDVFSEDEISHLEINLIMDTLDYRDIDKIVSQIVKNKTFKDITNDTIYTFIATVCPNKELPKIFIKMKGLLSRIDLVSTEENKAVMNETLRVLNKKKLPCSLIIRENNFDKIQSICRSNTTFGVPIFVEEEIKFDDNFLVLFKEWVYDKNGYRINIFADILSRILLDYWGTKCQYRSCLTKNFYIDADGAIYSCKSKKNKICNLQDVYSVSDILSHEKFAMLLKQAIAKRALCKTKCEFYEWCQGGCPLSLNEEDNECDEKRLFEVVDDIRELLCRIICKADYRELNPAVKDMILSGVASNKIFEKGMIV